jgi:DNA-binding CsgD family transcriptional regulator
MSRITRESNVVALLDWQGRVVWISEREPIRGVGFSSEEYAHEDYREIVKDSISRTIKQRESQTFHAVNEVGEHYRVWLWPVNSPDVAVCLLAIAIPEELALLSVREQDCLKLLAYGRSAAAISEELEIAVSTVHTHLRRSREKLNLPNLEALISFAARFCDTPHAPLPDAALKRVTSSTPLARCSETGPTMN